MTPDRAEGWRAYVSENAGQWARCTARLIIGRPHHDGRFEVVNRDGTSTVHEPGAELPDDTGWELPRAAFHAIGEAIQRWQGNTSHAATEARILREWLNHEQRRVDDALGGRLGT